MIMAEVLVTALLQRLSEKLLAMVAATGSELPSGVNKELENLLNALLAIKVSQVEAAEEEKDPVEKKALRAWLYDLKEAAYDADDVLDLVSVKTQDNTEGVNDMEDLDQHSCSLIKDIRERVENLVSKQPHSLHVIHASRFATMGIMPVEPKVFGREEEREKLIQLLTEKSSSQEDLSLVFIVGKWGVGKTTLARLVYDDERVASHFQLKFWLTASETYNDEKLLRSISYAVGHTNVLKNPDMGLIGQELRNVLKDKRFLLILDDFREEMVEWEMLLKYLKVGARGSKIVITAKIEKTVNNGRFHSETLFLEDLSLEDSWSVLRGCACLDHVSNEETEELEEVGMKMAAKLEGLPLAARMLGCLLRSNMDPNDWNMILQANVWSSKHGIPAALWLSYQYLPPHIKLCFAYCCGFPTGYKFDKENLVHMWMAQGLIQCRDGVRMLEDLGSEYFDYLLQRSFFQNFNGYCIMHQLVRRLASAITPDRLPNYENNNKKWRSLLLQSYTSDIDEFLDSGILESLRSLLFYGTIGSNFNYDALFMKLKCIRVLCLSDMGLDHLPASISKLKHLRFLDISETSIKILPEELCSLYNLQTLKLGFILSLPKGMSKLINLRHLKALHCQSMDIHQLGKLTSLQKLTILLECLEITGSSLEFLSEELLQRLTFLLELKIDSFHKVSFPTVLNKGLHCLVSLKSLHIYQCRTLRSLPNEIANIPSLEELYIIECGDLTSLPDNGVPATLALLVIHDCFFLSQRCQREGKDWSKISHVFYIEVDGDNVKEEEETSPYRRRRYRDRIKAIFHL